MDDLIFRKAVRDGMMKYGFHAPDMTVHEFVEDELPSVPAVPLDKLCEWLAHEKVTIPCRLCEYYSAGDCTVVNDVTKLCPNWRNVITKWMEEQDATD